MFGRGNHLPLSPLSPSSTPSQQTTQPSPFTGATYDAIEGHFRKIKRIAVTLPEEPREPSPPLCVVKKTRKIKITPGIPPGEGALAGRVTKADTKKKGAGRKKIGGQESVSSDKVRAENRHKVLTHGLCTTNFVHGNTTNVAHGTPTNVAHGAPTDVAHGTTTSADPDSHGVQISGIVPSFGGHHGSFESLMGSWGFGLRSSGDIFMGPAVPDLAGLEGAVG